MPAAEELTGFALKDATLRMASGPEHNLSSTIGIIYESHLVTSIIISMQHMEYVQNKLEMS